MQILDYYKRLTLPAKAAIWFTICNFLIKGIVFFTGPIFTRIMSSDEYGKLSVYLSYEQLILIIATWEIQLGAYQKGIFKYKDNVKAFTIATQALINILTIICFIIIFIFHEQVTKITGMPFSILVLLFIHLLYRPAYICWLARQRKEYRYISGVVFTLLYSLVSIIAPMAALLTFSKTANVKFGSTLIGTTIVCVPFFFKHSSYWKLKGDFQNTKQYWKFCVIFEAPLVLHSFSYLVLSQADRIMINEMVGASQAAFYSVAYSIASMIGIFQSSLNTTLSPWRYQMLEEKKYNIIKNVTNYLLMAFGIITIMFILVVPEIMKFLFTSNYYESIWCIPPIATGVYFMFLYSIFVNIEEYYEKTKYVVYVSATCGVINIILNYFCIDTFGYIACAYTTAFSYILFAVGHYLFMKMTLKQQGLKENVVDGRMIFIISLIVLFSSVIITISYNFIIWRYSLFVFSMIIVVFNYKKIRKALLFLSKERIEL